MAELTLDPYEYDATVVSIYDADTVTLDVDVGFHLKLTEKFRLYRINAYEVRGQERPLGLLGRDWLRGMAPKGSAVKIKTIQDKKGKYGRYLCELFIDSDGWFNVNDALVAQGHAIFRDY
jgi:micrococcal nuclease